MILVPLPLVAEAVERMRVPLQLEQAEPRGRQAQRASAAQVGVLLAVRVEVQRAPERVARAAHHQDDGAGHVEEHAHAAPAVQRVLQVNSNTALYFNHLSSNCSEYCIGNTLTVQYS